MIKNKHTPKNSGFTIAELLIVIVVIGILAAIGYVAYGGAQDRAREAVLRSDLTSAAELLNVDRIRSGGKSFPEDMNSVDNSRGLPASADTVYYYTANNSVDPPEFCLTGHNGMVALHITHEGVVNKGVCDGDPEPVVAVHSNDSEELVCDIGYIPVHGNSQFGTSDFCVMKYEAKSVDGIPTSQPSDMPWVSISQNDAIEAASAVCDTCHLITEAEWLTIAHDVVSVASNWSGGSIGNGYIYSGHTNNNPSVNLAASTDDNDGMYGITGGTGSEPRHNDRRTLTLSNGEVIWDFAGNVSEWTAGQTSGSNKQPGGSGYAWREWSTVSGTGGLTVDPFPSYGTPVAAGWNSNHGIGGVYSSATDGALRGFSRGGARNHGTVNNLPIGIFALNINSMPSTGDGVRGFRVAK